MKKAPDLNLTEKQTENSHTEYSETQVIIEEIDSALKPEKIVGSYPIRLKDSLLIVVLSGELYIDMNYQSHVLKKQMVVQLTQDDIILNISHSSDCRGFIVFISADLRAEIKSMKAGIRLQKASRLKRAYPVHKLDEEECFRVVDRIRNMLAYIVDETHLYRPIIIRNEVSNLFMDLDNSRTKKHGDGEVELSHAELLRERFRELLVEHCRKHREVSYYARELCVTSDYLSRVIKGFDGGSAMKWIATAVVTEAKYLIRQPGKTINQIALEMNFPDQSTFGKFFKKHTGMSPKTYKINYDKKEDNNKTKVTD